MSSKKRKSLSSPVTQASISNFFTSSERPMKKKRYEDKVEDDDDVIIISEKKQTPAPDQPSFSCNKTKSSSQEVTSGKCVGRIGSAKTPSKFVKKRYSGPKSIHKKNDDQLKENRHDREKKKEEENPKDETISEDRGVMFSDIKTMKYKVSFTALESQIVAIKTKHMDVLLFVEVGYRFRFFGEDAQIASKELNIQLWKDKNFLTASIPVQRLTVHMSKLIEKGYKVGVVKQTETAALKASGDNKSAPFTRKLSSVYTKATFVDRDEAEDSSMSGRYIVSISPTSNSIGVTYIGVLCVNPTSGDIAAVNLDMNERSVSKLQTIFSALNPSEVLLSKQMISAKIDAFIQNFCQKCEVRLERIEDRDQAPITDDDLKQRLGLEFPCEGVLGCIALMHTYLKEFQLEKILLTAGNYRHYSLQTNCLYLDGATLRNLEVLENSTDHTLKGSLLWILDHTSTVFGRRMLRRWCMQPLVSIQQIDARLDSVTELVTHFDSQAVQEMTRGLKSSVDVEKYLNEIFYRKISPDKFIRTLEALSKLNSTLVHHTDELNLNFQSPLLQSIFREVPRPKLLETCIEHELGRLNKGAASKGSKETLFRNEGDYPLITKYKSVISQLEKELVEHKDSKVRSILGCGPIEFKSVSGLEYLIEVKNKELKKVPKTWVKINSTKQVTRFRPPLVEEAFKKLCQAREKLKIAADAAWEEYLNGFLDLYDLFRQAVQKFAQLDCLLSLATVAKQSNYCRPVLVDGSECIEIVDGRHPVLSVLMPEDKQYVGNDTGLENENKSMIVSGPNMGGKSSYIRQVAVICILAQIGSYVPATRVRLSPLDGIYTRMGSSDDIAHGKSTFMMELEETSMIIKEATSKSLVVLDELGRGTSTYDGMAIAFATLKYFIEEAKSFTLFVTHYPFLSELEQLYPKNISNYHMSFIKSESEDSTLASHITFLYTLVKGSVGKSYGLNVARLANVPESIISLATIKSASMDEEVSARIRNVQFLKSIFQSDSPVDVLKSM